MKHYLNFLILIFTTSILISCSEEDLPNVGLSISNLEPLAGESLTFTISGSADTFVIFTGDENHDFEKSHIAITTGQDLDQEIIVLVSDSLPKIKDYLIPFITTYNGNVGINQQYDIDNVMSEIATLIDKEYTNKLTAAYEIWEFIPELNGETIRNIVDIFFENNSVILAPDSGFSTGFAVDKYEKTLQYTYNNPGTYIVTLIATNLSEKNYSGDGYQNDRTASADEYGIYRTYRELVITVQ
ncbi:hypothetical protein [Polaribacter sp.]|uniref:hypothetical protein n=1 Tax=Polaribacter sp. TaxID=1920175 RepID=UPI003F6CD95A